MSYDPAVSGPWSDTDQYPPEPDSIPACPVCGRPLVPMNAPYAANEAGHSVSRDGWVCADHGKFAVIRDDSLV